jgi:hypothetical protein
MTSYLDSRISRPQSLTDFANQVKGKGGRESHRGVTIELAQIEIRGERSFIAGINSGSTWTSGERALLRSWGVTVVEPGLRPKSVSGRPPKPDEAGLTRKNGGALHAEENMAIYIQAVGGRGIRWSRAVVGKCYDTKSGSRSYVCERCRSMIDLVGGDIEPPF